MTDNVKVQAFQFIDLKSQAQTVELNATLARGWRCVAMHSHPSEDRLIMIIETEMNPELAEARAEQYLKSAERLYEKESR